MSHSSRLLLHMQIQQMRLVFLQHEEHVKAAGQKLLLESLPTAAWTSCTCLVIIRRAHVRPSDAGGHQTGEKVEGAGQCP